jgi:hypothetical protein
MKAGWRVKTSDTDGGMARVFPSSGALVMHGPKTYRPPFVWLETSDEQGKGHAAHLTLKQAKVIRDALSAFISASGRPRRKPTRPPAPLSAGREVR